MKRSKTVSNMPLRLGAHWWMLAVTVVLLGLVAILVDLKPVDENFFFSTSDPQFQQSKKIEQRFRSKRGLRIAICQQSSTLPCWHVQVSSASQARAGECPRADLFAPESAILRSRTLLGPVAWKFSDQR